MWQPITTLFEGTGGIVFDAGFERFAKVSSAGNKQYIQMWLMAGEAGGQTFSGAEIEAVKSFIDDGNS